MKIPQNILEPRGQSGKTFLKAGSMGCKLGEHVAFQITGDIEVTQERTDKQGQKIPQLFSIPVETTYKEKKYEGNYNLNLTTTRALAAVLGDETENWIGARFTAFVQQQKNPQTQTYGPSFTVLDGSVKSAKTR